MRIATFTLLAAGILSWTIPVRADDGIPPDVLKAIKKATVFVKVKIQGGEASGSGFVVKTDDNTTYVVTNHHVIEPKVVDIVLRWVPNHSGPTVPHGPYGRSPHPLPRTYAPTPGPSYDLAPRVIVRTFKTTAVTVVFHSGTSKEQSVQAEVVAADPEVDLAILKAKDVKDVPAPIDFADESTLTETMPVYVFGFPLGQMMATNAGSPAITVGKASVSSLRLDDAGELAVVQIDGAINHGNSGGPIVDAKGRLVGVAVAFMKDSTSIGLAIPGRELPRMLSGRLGKPSLHVAQDGENGDAIKVEVGLIDPFHRVRTATLYYLAADKIHQKLQPTDHLKTLSGCHQLELKIEDQVAVGKISLKTGAGAVSLCCQAGYHNASGPERFTVRVEETLRPQAKEKAKEVAKVSTPGQPPTPTPTPAPVPTPAPKQVRPSFSPNIAPKTAADMTQIMADLKSGNFDRCYWAMKKLQRKKPLEPDAEVARLLAVVLLEDGSNIARATAAGTLASWGTKDSIPALEKALKDPDDWVRRDAKKAIDVIGLRYQPASPPASSAPAPGPAPSPTAPPSVAKSPGPSCPPRHGASDEPPSAEELETLVTDLKSGDFGRLIRSTMRLMRCKPKEPNPAVANALAAIVTDSSSLSFRLNAVRALENWGTAESIPALKKAAQDSNSMLQKFAKKAIGEITARQ